MRKTGENRMVGIGPNILKDLLIGLVVAVGFIIITKIVPSIGTIGIPDLQAISISDIGKFLIIVIAAPIFEELTFREWMIELFDKKLFDAPYVIAAIISSLLFAAFHWVAYGSNLGAASGSFIAAGIAGVGFAYLRKYSNSNTPNIVAHSLLNLYLGFITLGVVVGI